RRHTSFSRDWSSDVCSSDLHCRGALPRRGQREKGTEMKIDTEIRHVTKPGANLFLELGFAPAEAKRLQAASRKQINDTQLLKQRSEERRAGTQRSLRRTPYT